ncbi:hypothetical protein [Halobacterium zhouii]|uniref:hypothetical protein n=1 Tax=Halobacterium zhouii TaxID=2902624 RepID=UPI001E31B665|nr:hypothetical protein [Halobacterium zhouii]
MSSQTNTLTKSRILPIATVLLLVVSAVAGGIVLSGSVVADGDTIEESQQSKQSKPIVSDTYTDHVSGGEVTFSVRDDSYSLTASASLKEPRANTAVNVKISNQGTRETVRILNAYWNDTKTGNSWHTENPSKYDDGNSGYICGADSGVCNIYNNSSEAFSLEYHRYQNHVPEPGTGEGLNTRGWPVETFRGNKSTIQDIANAASLYSDEGKLKVVYLVGGVKHSTTLDVDIDADDDGLYNKGDPAPYQQPEIVDTIEIDDDKGTAYAIRSVWNNTTANDRAKLSFFNTRNASYENWNEVRLAADKQYENGIAAHGRGPYPDGHTNISQGAFYLWSTDWVKPGSDSYVPWSDALTDTSRTYISSHIDDHVNDLHLPERTRDGDEIVVVSHGNATYDYGTQTVEHGFKEYVVTSGEVGEEGVAVNLSEGTHTVTVEAYNPDYGTDANTSARTLISRETVTSTDGNHTYIAPIPDSWGDSSHLYHELPYNGTTYRITVEGHDSYGASLVYFPVGGGTGGAGGGSGGVPVWVWVVLAVVVTAIVYYQSHGDVGVGLQNKQ